MWLEMLNKLWPPPDEEPNQRGQRLRMKYRCGQRTNVAGDAKQFVAAAGQRTDAEGDVKQSNNAAG
jgi:hypothetical protein